MIDNCIKLGKVLLTGYDINMVCEGCIEQGVDDPRYIPHKPD